jgi:transcriptional regulator GlxA family with amidase domain
MANHVVAVVALSGFVAYDLSIPCEVFGTYPAGAADGYEVRVCAETPEVPGKAFSLRAPWSLDDLAQAHTVIIPGIYEPTLPAPEPVLAAIRRAAENGARIASICSGAFVLAATGLLDGRRATTHWLLTKTLADLYPAIEVDPNVLYVDGGRIVTSAGASAGLDMCLHLIRQDYGQAGAAEAARLAVAPLDRDGGQAQYIRRQEPRSTASLGPLLGWIEERLGTPLTIEDLSAQAATSPRTLHRRFRDQLGATPLQWLLDARIRRAQVLLETSALPVEEVARLVGFDSPSSFRERFRRVVGVSPNGYRRTFGGAVARVAA